MYVHCNMACTEDNSVLTGLICRASQPLYAVCWVVVDCDSEQMAEIVLESTD